MGLAFEIFELIVRILWCYIESACRFIIPVPRKKINGEIVLITGGGGKIGECIAMELVKEDVIIVLWDVNQNACERVADKLRKAGTTVYTYKCDLADKDHVYSTAKKVEEEVGHVTILINNAGIQFASTFLNSSDEELKKQVDVNTIAHFWTTKAFLPHMHEINHGHIVTVSSIAGLVGGQNLVAYSTSKFGSIGFHEALSAELMMTGKSGIKTSCLIPFMVDTPFLVKYSSRFPSVFTPLDPEFVGKECVDGMLRNKSRILVPKSLTMQTLIQTFLPEKALKLLHKFYATRVEEETTEARFQRMETTSIPKEKKSE